MEYKLIDFPQKVVYFEKQSNDRLCGLHCINSLLQGPYFDAVSLAEIAQKLDELEKELYAEDKYSNSKPYGNVDDDGNYNLQVLSEALKIYGAEIVPCKHTQCEKLLMESMDSVEAFIFNSSTHWFAIRKISNIWFNLNSTNTAPGPQIISDFYLSAFVKGTEELGYTNFLVKNVPALPDSNTFKDNLLFFQKFVLFEDIVKFKPKKINLGDSDEMALEKAIELSKNAFNLQTDKNIVSEYDYNDSTVNFNNYEINQIEQDDLKSILELSMNEFVAEIEKSIPIEPTIESEHAEVTLEPANSANGKKIIVRRFRTQDKIIDLVNLIKAKMRTYGKVILKDKLTNKIYNEHNKSLEEMELNLQNICLIYNIIE